jgi:hypothetical protein
MSTCDFTVTIQDANNQNFTVKSDSPASQPLTVRSDTSQCCTINVMNDVDITESSANNTILVWDTEFNLWVRRLLQANNISGLNDYLNDYFRSNDVVIDILDVLYDASVGRTFTANNVNVSGDLTVNGDIILRGSTLTLGDGGDVININATVNNHFISASNNTFDLGSPESYWRNLYVQNITVGDSITLNDVTVIANVDASSVRTTNLYATDATISANLNAGVINADSYYGDGSNLTNIAANSVTLGDSCISNGAVSLANDASVCDALSYINQALFNVQQATFIRSIEFTGTPTFGGEGTTVTLSTNIVGVADRLNIDWGDGSWTNATSDFTPSHTYKSNENSPYTISVYAYNIGATGAGSNTSSTRADYITIYTADPAVDFAVYDVSTGGSELAVYEANTGQEIYLENLTKNIANNSTTATWRITWGDGNTETVDGKTEDGGSQGARLAHTYTTDSGSGSHTITVNCNSCSTATPGIFPISNTALIKIFDTTISAPEDLSTKNISWANDSQGSSPALSNGFESNATGKSAGDIINSSFPRFTSGTKNTAEMSTLFHTTGSISQEVNDTTAGTPIIDSSNVDYYNYDSSGSPVAASDRIYAPELYETGTKARVSYDITSGSVGVNKVELSSDEGNSNELFYVYDDVTATPTVDISSATVTHGSGDYNYISGIPYYQSGGTVTISGVSVNDLTGQTYYNGNAITVDEVDVGGGSGTVIPSQSYNYSTALASGDRSSNIPNADLSPNLEDLTVTLSNGDNIVYPRVTARNVNGTGSATLTSFPISVFNGTDFIDEGGIPVSDDLGLIYDTDGLRISGLTGANPTLSDTTNYYVDNAWTGAETVAGTDEAIIRYGALSHDETDYSTYFPIGPDLSTGRSGTQYFRFAFQRSAMSIFRFRMTGRISGMYIAAPGTSIDNTSTLNGWLDASLQYAGSGVPGANIPAGGNGSNGCAYLGADKIIDGEDYVDETFDITLGTESSTNAYEDQIIVTLVLNSDDSVTALSVEAAS